MLPLKRDGLSTYYQKHYQLFCRRIIFLISELDPTNLIGRTVLYYFRGLGDKQV